MTPERALEVIRQQNQFPYWGNFTKFMDADERAEVNRLWSKAPGNWSIASVVFAIARGESVPVDPARGRQ